MVGDSEGWLGVPAGHEQFRLRLPGVDPHRISVETFTSTDHAVSCDYGFEIGVSCAAPLDLETVLGRRASLALALGETPSVVHGIVAGVETTGAGTHGVEALVRLRSPLCLAAARTHHRVFRRLTAPQIACQVLEAALDGVAAVVVEGGDSAPEQPMVVQNNESDLDFVRRVLARDGLFMTVRQADAEAEVVFHDDLGAVTGETITLRYERQSGQVRGGRDTVHALRAWSVLEPEKVRLGDFDPAIPDRSEPAEALQTGDMPGAGTLSLYGHRGGGRDASAALADVHLAALDAKRQGVEIETECRRLAPGVTVDLTNHPDDAINGTYVVISADHQGDQAAALRGGDDSGRPTYRCKATLLPAHVAYREAPVAPGASGHGLLLGEVEGTQTSRAHLDDEGAYRVRLALDDSDSKPGQASPPVRMVQPYGGKEYGMHFPLLPETKVVMAGLNGDGERPVILGALPTASQRPPVTTRNPHQHLLRTPAGHALCLDDNPTEPRVSLTAAKDAGRLVMETGRDEHRVLLQTPGGDLELDSGADMTIRSGGDRRVEVEGEYVVGVGGDHTIHTERGTLDWSAAETLQLATEEGDLLQESTDGGVGIRSGDALRLEAGDGLTIRTSDGDSVLIADAGALDLEVEGDLALVSTGDGDIAIGGQAGLRIDGNGDVILDGEQVRISGNQITLAATDISEN